MTGRQKNTSISKIHLSPSEHHRYLASHLDPSLRYKGQDFEAWKRVLKRKLRQLLGDMPQKRCPLKPCRIWKREHSLGSIEKIVFTSEPVAEVLAYICLPKGIKPPYPFVICLQGHSTGMHNSIAVQREDETRAIKVEGDRDFAISAMKQGIAALCIEQRSFGERREQKQASISEYMCHDAVMQALMLGRTMIGERIFDVDRAIDYLASRGDVDMDTIGIMGNSGGGTVSIYAAAVLPRISFAMPSASFCTFSDSIMSIFHCGCNYIPQIMKYADMSDIMGLFAPKPAVIVAGQHDPIFPIKGTRKAFRDLKKIYTACGAEKHCHLVIGDGGHRFYADKAWPVMKKEMLGFNR